MRRLFLCTILLLVVAQPVIAAEPVPLLYKMFDYGTVPTEEVPFGSTHWYMWRDLNPRSGEYNWDPIEQHLIQEEGITVTLPSGEVIPKPVVLFIIPHLSDSACQNVAFIDCTPDWVYRAMDASDPSNPRPVVCGRRVGHELKSGSLRAVIPAYDHWYWRARWIDFVNAFCEEYAGDPRITAIVASTGLDGETQPAKTWFGVDWRQLLGSQASGVEYRFAQNHVPDTLEAYVSGLPDKRVFLNMAPGGEARLWWLELAQRYPNGVGKKNSGQQPDQDIHQGFGTYPGTWDAFVPGVDELPVWTETAHSIGSDEWGYWSIFCGLHYMPRLMTLHSDWFTRLDPEFLHWTVEHLGGKLADVHTVWTVLRDKEYPLQTWAEDKGASGHVGDWSQGLQRVSDAQVVWRDELPVEDPAYYGRQCRMVDGRVGFEVAQEWISVSEGPYAVHIVLLDHGDDMFEVGWTRESGTPAWARREKSGSGWRHYYFTLNNIDLSEGVYIDSLESPEYVHMVEIYTDTTPGPTQTALPGPSLYPTNTLYPTTTMYPTNTRYPTFTPVPTCTPTRTIQPTYTSRPTYTPRATYTPRPTYTEQPNCT